MKSIILYGDNVDLIEKRLIVFRKKATKDGFNIVDINDDNLKTFNLSGSSLFSQKTIYFADNFKTDQFDYYKKLTKTMSEDDIFVVTTKSPPKKDLKEVLGKNTVYEQFVTPKIIWSFLESIYPGNLTNIFRLKKDVVKNTPGELLLHLVAMQFIQMYEVLNDGKNIPEWKRHRLLNQASKFKGSGIADMINDLSEIDIKVKSSSADISSELDFLFISKLK